MYREGKDIMEENKKSGRETTEASVGGEVKPGGVHGDASAFVEQSLSVSKANETKWKEDGGNQCGVSLLALSSTKNQAKQRVSVSVDCENIVDGLIEEIELDAAVEADMEKEYIRVGDKEEEELNEGEDAIVDMEVSNEVGENSTEVDLGGDLVPSEDTGEEETVAESEDEGDHLTDILTPALSLLILNITMPCVDFYFDASLIRILFSNNWGCLFTLVCALAANFLFTSFAWWRIEPKSQKAWTWIFLILQIWPQLKAFQVPF